MASIFTFLGSETFQMVIAKYVFGEIRGKYKAFFEEFILSHDVEMQVRDFFFLISCAICAFVLKRVSDSLRSLS